MPENFCGQNYSKLKKTCLDKGILFEDLDFPANHKSLFFSKVDNEIEWKRPPELCKVPRLVVEGVSCDDLNEGELGNIWFVTACASLALEPKLWRQVIVNHKDQEWDDKNQYAGIFCFNFWRYGAWISVVVDDLLPTKNGKLVFCHSKSRNEFWSALLEKAYAKLYGDYESLMFGYVADALVDFTGGVAEKLVLSELLLQDWENREALFDKMLDAIELKAFINCHIECAQEAIGSTTDQGLIEGKGYNITDVKMVNVNRPLQGVVGADKLMLIRLSNPWGTVEWTGPWSDSSPEWTSVNSREWEKMGVKFKQEGDFWMCYDDFLRNFTNVDICHFVNTSFFSLKKTWSEAIIHSKWSHNGRNGGRDYYSSTFLSNPQVMFDITGLSETIMVSLEQNDTAEKQKFLGKKICTIGFHIMKVEENRKFRVHVVGEKKFTSAYKMSRSMFGTCTLPKGRYVIVPTTMETGEVGEFIIRLYTSGSSSARELKKDGPTKGCMCSSNYQLVTVINVKGAEQVELPPKAKGACDPLVLIRCEGETVKSLHCQNTTSPVWNVKAIFYRKKPDEPIVVEVWSHRTVLNDFLGEARIDELGTEDGVTKKFLLWGRKKEKSEKKPGYMTVNVRSSHELTFL